MNIKELFLQQKATEHESTLPVYGKIPSDRVDWHPAEGMLSLGQIARHAWRSEEGMRRIALDGDWSYAETRFPQSLFVTLGEVKSLDEELQAFRRVHQETLRAAQAFPLERWDEIRESAQFHMRRSIGVILFRIIEHQVHHRAQVGTYLHILTGGRASPYDV